MSAQRNTRPIRRRPADNTDYEERLERIRQYNRDELSHEAIRRENGVEAVRLKYGEYQDRYVDNSFNTGNYELDDDYQPFFVSEIRTNTRRRINMYEGNAAIDLMADRTPQRKIIPESRPQKEAEVVFLPMPQRGHWIGTAVKALTILIMLCSALLISFTLLVTNVAGTYERKIRQNNARIAEIEAETDRMMINYALAVSDIKTAIYFENEASDPDTGLHNPNAYQVTEVVAKKSDFTVLNKEASAGDEEEDTGFGGVIRLIIDLME